jgi:hypothetical protein
MKLYNNTNDEVEYTISSATSDNCGNIDAGQTADEPFFDNMQGVTVDFSTDSGNPFNITIPESKEGVTVTIGLYFE